MRTCLNKMFEKSFFFIRIYLDYISQLLKCTNKYFCKVSFSSKLCVNVLSFEACIVNTLRYFVFFVSYFLNMCFHSKYITLNAALRYIYIYNKYKLNIIDYHKYPKNIIEIYLFIYLFRDMYRKYSVLNSKP